MNIKAVVFDIGGTLMEYRNMPNVWIDYYKTGFEFVRSKLGIDISDSDIEKSVEVLKSYNPRVKYREEDIAPEVIFGEACAHWKCLFKPDEVIDVFYRSMGLTPYIYPETIDVLEMLKAQEYIAAALTDVAAGMPDELHKSYFPELMPYFDMYVSSLSCGMRKPNPKGLRDIADRFGISPDEMIFVGDEEKDIKTAERFGCVSVLIDRKGSGAQFGQWYTIDDLDGIWGVLGNTYGAKFCTQCGKPLVYKAVGDEGEQRYCPRCDKFYFDDPACCVLAAVINKNNQVLLLKQNYISEEKYTLCSGYVKKGETLEEAVRREVGEETGYSVYRLEYVDSYYFAPKGLIMPGFIAYVNDLCPVSNTSKEIDELLWVDFDKAADMVLSVNNFSGIHLDNVIERLTGKRPFISVKGTSSFSGFINLHGKYTVAFKDMIYNSYKDGIAYDKIIEKVIKPEEKSNLGSMTDMWGDFTKDKIRIDTRWDSMFDYYWEAYIENEETEKKVLEWAAAVSEEFLKLKEKVLSEENLFLAIPDESHEEAYTKMISRWEKNISNISPSLLGRYSDNKKRNLTYSEWLACCEDDRTTGSMLSTGVPCTLYFLINGSGEILGGIEINHANTHRGHLHAGISPWNRSRGYGKIMLKLALEKCREMGFDKVEICTHKDNVGAIKTILSNGGVLTEEFLENGIWNNRYSIEL